MIAGCADVKVIKFCIHCNEVDTNTCDWLPIIYQTIEVGLCYFALDPERGDIFLAWEQESGRRRERKEQSLFLFQHHMQAVMLVCALGRRAKTVTGVGGRGGEVRQWM